MGGSDKAFFYTAWHFSLNQLVLCLVDHPFLESWDARYAYLIAKAEERRLRLYEMDLEWLNVKRLYENLPRPSEIATKKPQKVKKDNRTAQQIKDDIVRKLRQG